MNLNEFIKYGQICPICKSNSMSLEFGISKQQYRYEKDDVIFIREMRGIKKGSKKYNVGYSINKYNNQFQIEFYDGDVKLNFIPNSVLQRFKELHTNIKNPFNLLRRCTNCNKYQYWSNSSFLNYKTLKFEEFKVDHEYWGICKQIGSKFRIFKIYNNYVNNKCNITCHESSSNIYAEFSVASEGDHLNFKLEPINFTTETQLANKLNKLLVFA